MPLRQARQRAVRPRPGEQASASASPPRKVGLVVVDAALGLVQRNLERAWVKGHRPPGLILEIFGARAKNQGRPPAGRARGADLGARAWCAPGPPRAPAQRLPATQAGPGEAQIELDRRRIDGERIVIQRGSRPSTRTRGLHREARGRAVPGDRAGQLHQCRQIRTLFNRLTGATVGARDQLFATLDPTMRTRAPSGPQGDLSVQRCFIADLPTDLVAFRATLEEVRSAELVIHVRDVAVRAAQRADVLEVLALDLQQSARRGPPGGVLEQARSARRRGRGRGARRRGTHARWSWARRAAARASTTCGASSPGASRSRSASSSSSSTRPMVQGLAWLYRPARCWRAPRAIAASASSRAVRRGTAGLARDFPPDAIL